MKLVLTKVVLLFLVFFIISILETSSKSQTKSFGCQCGKARQGAYTTRKKRHAKSMESEIHRSSNSINEIENFRDNLSASKSSKSKLKHLNNVVSKWLSKSGYQKMVIKKSKSPNKPKSTIDKHSRIVNGYEPRKRPWIALITINR